MAEEVSRFAESGLSRCVDGARVYCGVGSLAACLAEALAPWRGRRILVVTGQGFRSREGEAQRVLQRLADEFEWDWCAVAGEPEVEWVDAQRQRLQGNDTACAAVLSIGGGSALDAGKALAALLTESAPAKEYLEGVGSLRPSGRMLPWIAVPTTGGTGSEASTNAVLGSRRPPVFKKSLRHAGYRPHAVILDGKVMVDLPRMTLAASAMDALTQLLESYLSPRADADLSRFLQAAIEQMVPVMLRLLPPDACLIPADGQVLLEAAFASGVGLSRAGLGTVHGFAGPLGAQTELPHGLICARLLGPVLQASHARLQQQDSSGDERATTALRKLALLFHCQINEGHKPHPFGQLSPRQWMYEIAGWADAFALPRFAAYWPSDLERAAILAQVSNRDNPAELSASELAQILTAAM